MKLIVMFVRPLHAPRLVQALQQAGLYHLSLARVHGVVHPDEPIAQADMGPNGSQEVRIDAYCEDARVEAVVALACEAGHIGGLPSGALFVHPVEQARTIGERRQPASNGPA